MESDDSDFYGDADTINSLQSRVDSFDVQAWYRQRDANPGRPVPRQAVASNISHAHNPYAGVPYAWQLTETVDDFLRRLPPSITSEQQVPWIFICNPYIPRIDKRLSDQDQTKGRENGDEAPDEDGANVGIVIEGGTERLEFVKSLCDRAMMTNMPKAKMEREMAKERKQATADILNLAHAYKVRAGKWMLFCQSTEVDEVWKIVAKATANNELGIAAKVAPKEEGEDGKRDRLVCIYTADFKNKADVGRVLQSLRELRLVEARGATIYYKPDAFTYIGIGSGNHWGLRASIYSSRDSFD